MTQIDSGILALATGKPVVTKGNTDQTDGEGSTASDGKGFAETFASVSGDGERKSRGRLDLNQGETAVDTTTSGIGDKLSLSRLGLGALGTQASGSEGATEETTEQFTLGTDAEEKAGRTKVGSEFSKLIGKAQNATGATGEKSVEEDGESDATDASTSTDVDQLLTMLSGTASGEQQASLLAGAAQGVLGQATAKGGTSDRGDLSERKVSKTEQKTSATTTADVAESASDAAEQVEAEPSETDKIFRLIRADGKGREMELGISGDGETATIRDANAATTAKSDAVTVIESRRYLGLAQSSNSAAVTAAIAQDPDWAAQMTSASGLDSSATGTTVNTLKIQMSPIDLGLVTATLRLSGDELVVSLQVETGEAYRQLTDDQDQIVKALRSHGFAVDQVSIQFTPTDKGASGGQQGNSQSQPQFTGQQQQPGDGRSGQQSGSQQGSSTWNSRGGANDQGSAQAIAGTQSQQPGGVYL
ncbi:flagellar hook-length control protein FliK [Sinorhizobium sp. BG8]|uniref:flagellar hook-length control protein FliK n=1 Tax=Sinorhizobium sp. BG8 TaxID=2613773 RepID=UPI00193E009A|nr:flagellar hook-length control protein FliK [Sinorhizobium sp. BG8]QRM54244.1 flagellar hook-length control protein FliK [Sinorhizobium sp. BG8]